jgi:adenosylcobinamide-phosphate synthase
MIGSHIFLIILILAYALDLIIGDPPNLPHPVRIIGKCVNSLEQVLRHGVSSKKGEWLAGILLTTTIVLTTFLIAFLLEKWVLFGIKGIWKIIGMAFLIYLTATTLATKELLKSGLNVILAVKEDNIRLAREHLSMIVGRDVNVLDRNDILRATIETLSENLSDGIIAPLFYLVIGGIPLGLAYKAVNTLDSIVGYTNEKYRYFGWASARLDDLFNYIPARVSGILIAVSAAVLLRSMEKTGNAFNTMYYEGKKHTSPNSGYPEAAMAGALHVRLGGPATYQGILVEKPYIGAHNQASDYLSASTMALKIVRLASFCGFFVAIIVQFLRIAL